MKIEQAALFGAGSVGGSLLCRQRENLDKIKVIVHGSRRERMEKEGLLTRGETFFPKIWEKGSYPDLLMVGLKNTQLKAAIAELEGLCWPQYHPDASDERYFCFRRTAGSFSGKHSFDCGGLCRCQKNWQ